MLVTNHDVFAFLLSSNHRGKDHEEGCVASRMHNLWIQATTRHQALQALRTR